MLSIGTKIGDLERQNGGVVCVNFAEFTSFWDLLHFFLDTV